MRRLVILGSTGSVGTSALDVVATLKERFRVVGLAAQSSDDKLVAQARAHRVETIALEDAAAGHRAQGALPGTTVFSGPGAALELLSRVEADVILQATVGAAALATTLRAIEKGGLVALANKESLVMAGPLLTAAAKTHGATVIPVDSEHSAIFQCLRAGRADEVERIILTASGGAFRDRPLADLPRVRPDEALKHPTWKMGPRITVDSATMMNKALEIGEAVALFGLTPDKIRVVIHPQSIVHSMVEFRDGSVIAQLGVTDMRLPIQYACSYPERWDTPLPPLDLVKAGRLDFCLPDRERFPRLELAYQALRTGGTLPCVLNAANEVAVETFLNGALPFTGIAHVIAETMNAHQPMHVDTLETVLQADQWARDHARAVTAG
jgi:1-deoxy-D-xylulose-5-phosphate reductoisomerase